MNKLFAILMLITSSSSYACMCSNSPTDVTTVFEQATGIYLAVVSKVEAVNSSDGRAELATTLTVLTTYKGSKQITITGVSESPYPTKDDAGGYLTQSTSCDSHYTIGQEFLLATFTERVVSLGQCSLNVLDASPKNLKILSELSSNKALHGTSP